MSGYGRYRSVRADSDGLYYLLYCPVVVGESCLGREDMKVPDEKPSGTNTLYETATDHVDAEKAKYWITHLDHQAVPEYVLCFRERSRRERRRRIKPYSQSIAQRLGAPQQPRSDDPKSFFFGFEQLQQHQRRMQQQEQGDEQQQFDNV